MVKIKSKGGLKRVSKLEHQEGGSGPPTEREPPRDKVRADPFQLGSQRLESVLKIP